MGKNLSPISLWKNSITFCPPNSSQPTVNDGGQKFIADQLNEKTLLLFAHNGRVGKNLSPISLWKNSITFCPPNSSQPTVNDGGQKFIADQLNEKTLLLFAHNGRVGKNLSPISLWKNSITFCPPNSSQPTVNDGGQKFIADQLMEKLYYFLPIMVGWAKIYRRSAYGKTLLLFAHQTLANPQLMMVGKNLSPISLWKNSITFCP
ncbi:hypothetical protein [Moorena producens]|uniref:hypothetical protein n=1 Tax=Moorena producens TaxID=1155739 RepID=UPI0011EA65E1|nr:hypothetical protein [Moorena producens]